MKHVIGRLRSWNSSQRNIILSATVSTMLLVALINVVQIRAPMVETVRHIFVPTEFSTIQEAVNNASDGDFVEVIPRILPYSESVKVNKSLTVRRWPEAPSDPVIIEGGFRLVNTTTVTIANFTIQNDIGIRVFNSNGVVLERNIISGNTNGIDIDRSSNVTLVNNVLTNNFRNFGVSGVELSHYLHNIDANSNTINGKLIRYLINQTNLVIDSVTNIGYLGFVNSKNVTIRSLSFLNNAQGVLLAYTNSSTIQDITALYNAIGIDLVSSSHNKLRNIIASNNDRGLLLLDSDNNTIEKNVVSQSGFSSEDGISMWNSNDNIVRNNSISVFQGVSGISMMGLSSSRNVVSNNSISYSVWSSGIYVGGNCNVVCDNNILSLSRQGTSGIYISFSSANVIHGNTIVDNYHGIDLVKSVDNVFFHNNIYNSNFQTYSYNSSTIWALNDLEGNYWSDYTGVDKDKDGIGDTPYRIENYEPLRYNNDTRPLMEPWKPTRIHPDSAWHGIGIWNTTVTTFSNSTVTPFILKREEEAMLINVTSGAGGFLEATILRDRLDGPFRLFINDTEVFSYVLNQNETHTVIYFNFTQGFYRIKIVGTRLGLIFGDMNRDGKVDGKDIAIVAKNFGYYAPP